MASPNVNDCDSSQEMGDCHSLFSTSPEIELPPAKKLGFPIGSIHCAQESVNSFSGKRWSFSAATPTTMIPICLSVLFDLGLFFGRFLGDPNDVFHVDPKMHCHRLRTKPRQYAWCSAPTAVWPTSIPTFCFFRSETVSTYILDRQPSSTVSVSPWIQNFWAHLASLHDSEQGLALDQDWSPKTGGETVPQKVTGDSVPGGTSRCANHDEISPCFHHISFTNHGWR